MCGECFFGSENMKCKNPFKCLTKFEWGLWIASALVVTLTQLLSPSGDILSLIASLIGVTALIFVAKGFVLGQLLCILFAVLYGIISLRFHYYGEVITYVCMSAPMAILATISWIKHPQPNSSEVTVARLGSRKIVWLTVFTLIVTLVFYFILGALGTANLMVSTISVATSFLAASLTFLRSPYYALAYAANDIVLIVLWVLATIIDISYLCMIFCFVMFLLNDLYGFFNWRRMQRRQSEHISA
jgi:nicotinamide mononucleotide transporter PnuC